MMKSILVWLGLKAAPTPWKKYLMVGQFGFWPVVGYFAWRHRDDIKALVQKGQSRLTSRSERSESSTYRQSAPAHV